MKGLELSKAYWEQFGKPMLEEKFPQYIDKIAVGLVGHGSECFGFDDEISRDHDFDAGFSIWLTDEINDEIGFQLFREYSKLPKEFEGCKLQEKSAFGNDSKGVHTISEFYSAYTGRNGAPECWQDWLYTNSSYFAEATNGEVFHDPLGEFTEIRNIILNDMPEDVRLKKIASKALLMAQTGQYNYPRLIAHEDNATAQMVLSRFVEHTANMIYLLNCAHAPYYKWLLRGAEKLTILGDKVSLLRTLLTDVYMSDGEKRDLIEYISKCVIDEIVAQGLCKNHGDYLEPYAFRINDKIRNSEIRNLHIILE